MHTSCQPYLIEEGWGLLGPPSQSQGPQKGPESEDREVRARTDPASLTQCWATNQPLLLGLE